MKDNNKDNELDLSLHQAAEDLLVDKLTNELINAMSLQRALQLLTPICKKEAIRLTKEGTGKVKEEIEAARKSILKGIIAKSSD